MIQKFIAIKNIGKFRNCGAAGDVDFRKLTLIFAENGRGKTTLCAILRSIQSGDPLFISERKTLGLIGISFVDIRISGGNCRFDGSAWNQKIENLAIFDSTYVAENVYSGDFVEHEHKKRLYSVTVGKQGVELAQKVADLDRESRDLSSKLQELAKSLGKKVPVTMKLPDFLALKPDNGIDQKITDKRNQLQAFTDAQTIKTKSSPTKLTLPEIPETIEGLLRKSLQGVSKEVENIVHQQVRIHNMGGRGEDWISTGLTFVHGEGCPFCNQSIAKNALIAAYGVYFGAAYKALKAEIAQLETGFAAAFSDKKIAGQKTTIAENTALALFWQKYCTVNLPELDFDKVVSPCLSDIQREFSALIAKKKSEPLDALALSEAAQKAKESLAQLKSTIGLYNAAVEAANIVIAAVKKNAESGNAATLEHFNKSYSHNEQTS